MESIIITVFIILTFVTELVQKSNAFNQQSLLDSVNLKSEESNKNNVIEGNLINNNMSTTISVVKTTLDQMFPFSATLLDSLDTNSRILKMYHGLSDDAVIAMHISEPPLPFVVNNTSYYLYSAYILGKIYLMIKYAELPLGKSSLAQITQMKTEGWSIIVGKDGDVKTSIPPKGVMSIFL